MKAAVLHEFRQPLRIEDIPRPVCGADEVLLQVEACGVCHSDLHLAEGDWREFLTAVPIKRPVILGHEVVGRVVEKGTAVDGLAVGERVGVPWIHWTCGQCEQCRAGRENLCPAQTMTGVTVDGGYAEFMKAKASHALRVPAALAPEQAAPLFCAGVTVYRALKNANIEPGQRVGVFGVGGLGHLAVQVAKGLGAEVIGVDIAEKKLELARAFGADRVSNAASPTAVRELRGRGGVHVALVTATTKAAYELAFAALRPAGTLVSVGLPAESPTFSLLRMSGGELRIVASSVGTRQDSREVLELAAAGKLRAQVETRPLEQINEIFDQLRRGQILGRVVVRPRSVAGND